MRKYGMYHYVFVSSPWPQKKLTNFCKQFSHFEIKMTRSLKLNSRLIVSLIFYEFAYLLLNYASNSIISERFSFCS